MSVHSGIMMTKYCTYWQWCWIAEYKWQNMNVLVVSIYQAVCTVSYQLQVIEYTVSACLSVCLSTVRTILIYSDGGETDRQQGTSQLYCVLECLRWMASLYCLALLTSPPMNAMCHNINYASLIGEMLESCDDATHYHVHTSSQYVYM